ncbi:MAG: type II toxin-antitoxin system VapC family toxin [Bradyrhizobium sp.]
MSSARSKASSKGRRIVINDASCLIDLHKVNLVEVMLQLPYDFVVALPVAHNELLDFTKKDWRRLASAGLVQVDLDPGQVGRAIALRSQNTKLTAEDCFSLVLAEDIVDSILLTGDAELRNIAVGKGCEVHGVIWVTDEIQTGGLLTNRKLIDCLNAWLNDPLIRLPAGLLQARLKALAKK